MNLFRRRVGYSNIHIHILRAAAFIWKRESDHRLDNSSPTPIVMLNLTVMSTALVSFCQIRQFVSGRSELF